MKSKAKFDDAVNEHCMVSKPTTPIKSIGKGLINWFTLKEYILGNMLACFLAKIYTTHVCTENIVNWLTKTGNMTNSRYYTFGFCTD